MFLLQQAQIVEGIILKEMDPNVEDRFISSTNFETNTLNLIVLHLEVSKIKFNLSKLYDLDTVNWHIKAGEIITR